MYQGGGDTYIYKGGAGRIVDGPGPDPGRGLYPRGIWGAGGATHLAPLSTRQTKKATRHLHNTRRLDKRPV